MNHAYKYSPDRNVKSVIDSYPESTGGVRSPIRSVKRPGVSSEKHIPR